MYAEKHIRTIFCASLSEMVPIVYVPMRRRYIITTFYPSRLNYELHPSPVVQPLSSVHGAVCSGGCHDELIESSRMTQGLL